MNVAIIPARGGSKRLPRKNIRMFCGKPLVAWSIIQALNSYFIDDVYVSTDDQEIAEIA
jgi:pseudaminic acid cytidylyltransferase